METNSYKSLYRAYKRDNAPQGNGVWQNAIPDYNVIPYDCTTSGMLDLGANSKAELTYSGDVVDMTYHSYQDQFQALLDHRIKHTEALANYDALIDRINEESKPSEVAPIVEPKE